MCQRDRKVENRDYRRMGFRRGFENVTEGEEHSFHTTDFILETVSGVERGGREKGSKNELGSVFYSSQMTI